MGQANANSNDLLQTVRYMQYGVRSIELTRNMIKTKYQQLGTEWHDKQYRELGEVLNECYRALGEIEKIMLQAEKYVATLIKSIQEYDNINLSSNSSYGSLSRHMTTEEVNESWKSVVKNTDELIKTYRTEMTALGVFDGALLTQFLSVQRSQMLQFEAETLNAASGSRPPLDDDEIYHYAIVGENSPYTYSNLVGEFGDFCVQQVKSWIGKINPNPNNDPRRTVNCGQCAAAVYQRMNGNNNAVAGLGTYSISEMNAITGRTQTTMTPEQIASYLQTQGAGAHVVVGVDRASGAGHWFNAFYDGRQVYTIEGQGGTVNGWPPDYGNVVHWDVSI